MEESKTQSGRTAVCGIGAARVCATNSGTAVDFGLGPRSADRFLGTFVQPNYLRERWWIVEQSPDRPSCARELDYLFLLGSSSGLT